MSDAASRSLSRLASLTGSPHDQARVLVERLRRAPPCEACGGSGLVPGVVTVACAPCAGTGSPLRARVELAAYCGDEGAAMALNLSRFRVLDQGAGFVKDEAFWESRVVRAQPWGERWRRVFAAHNDWEAARAQANPGRWVLGLSRWGVVVEVRAAVAAADHAASGMDVEGVALTCMDAARAWLAAPSESARMEWVEAWRQSWGRPFDGPHQHPWLPVPPNATPHPPGVTTWSPGPTPVHTIGACASGHGEATVREAIQRALVSWALGEEP